MLVKPDVCKLCNITWLATRWRTVPFMLAMEGKVFHYKLLLLHCDPTAKLCSINSFRCSIRCFTDFLHSPYRLNINTIDRAYFRTLITNYAIINLIMQLIPTVIRHWQLLKWILQGYNTFLLVKIFIILYAYWITHRSCIKQMAHSQLKPLRKGSNGIFNICYVCFQ